MGRQGVVCLRIAGKGSSSFLGQNMGSINVVCHGKGTITLIILGEQPSLAQDTESLNVLIHGQVHYLKVIRSSPRLSPIPLPMN